jgi:hypothetical protein
MASAIAADPAAHRSSAHVNAAIASTNANASPANVCEAIDSGQRGFQGSDRPSIAAGRLSVSVQTPLGRMHVHSAQRAMTSAGSVLHTNGTPGVSRFVAIIGPATLTLLVTNGANPAVLGGILDRSDASAQRSDAFLVEPVDTPTQEVKALLELTALEHLYVLIREREPAAGSFSFGTARESTSQWDVLRSVAVARECAAARLGGWVRSGGIKLWRTVNLQESNACAPRCAREHDTVAARAENDRGPIAGAAITFLRAPHMTCTAVTDGAGHASCTLWDAHGHDESHEDEGESVVVTFSGVIGQESIDLPTAALLKD